MKNYDSKTKKVIDRINNRMDMTKTVCYPETKCEEISLNTQKRSRMGKLRKKLRDCYGLNCISPSSYVEALSTYLQYSLSLYLKIGLLRR